MNSHWISRTVRLTIAFLIVVFSGMAVLGISQDTADRKTTEPTLWPRDMRYRLQIGDTLEIIFRFTPEFNQTVTIQPDGYINLRDLPDLRAAGKTTPELVEALKKAYSRILHDPVVTLQLKEFEKPYFIAGGELGRPGKYDLRGDTTLVQAIEMAGGFKETSKHSQVCLYHRVQDGWDLGKRIDVKAMHASGNLTEDLNLRPGDLIYVPKNTYSKIKPFIPTMQVGAYVPMPW